ncbi:MAG TPA: MFS transporter [Chloroflexota bacterium]
MLASKPLSSEAPALPGRTLVLFAVAIGYIGVMLAVSPVSVALPTAAGDLGVNVGSASWVQTAYLLALTALVLPAGRLGDLIGYKRIFVSGVALMAGSAALLGFTSELWLMVVLRGIEGVGSAMISGTTLAILTAAFRASERGRVVGFATVAGALGAGGGTLLTPLVLDHIGWRGVFWLIVPVGVVSLVLALKMPAVAAGERTHRSIDIPGALLLTGSLLALSLSFNHLHGGEETFAAGWPYHTTMEILAGALLVAFIWVEGHTREPLIPLAYLRHSSFAAAVMANGIFHMTMMATMFLTPFLFEQAWGLTPLHVSLVIGLLQGVNLGTALVGGWVVDRMRWSALPAVSLGLIAGGMLLLGLLGSSLTLGTYVLMSVLLGMGSGLFTTSNNTAIMSILPPGARGFSSGMLEMMRQFGHTVAVSLGAVAIGLAGASLQGVSDPGAMLEGFRLAEIIMGSIAAAGVAIAFVGRARSNPRDSLPELVADVLEEPVRRDLSAQPLGAS